MSEDGYAFELYTTRRMGSDIHSISLVDLFHHDSIFAGQVSDSRTLINPLADVVSDYISCFEIPGHSIKLHLVNNMKTV